MSDEPESTQNQTEPEKSVDKPKTAESTTVAAPEKPKRAAEKNVSRETSPADDSAQNPELNALLLEVQALRAEQKAEREARAAAELKAQRLEAEKATDSLFTSLGFTDNAHERAALSELVENRTAIHEGKRVWKQPDGKFLPLEAGLKEFQKTPMGQLFARKNVRSLPGQPQLANQQHASSPPRTIDEARQARRK